LDFAAYGLRRGALRVVGHGLCLGAEKKLEARKMPVNRADFQPSAAHFVSPLLAFVMYSLQDIQPKLLLQPIKEGILLRRTKNLEHPCQYLVSLQYFVMH
jgi:hypothetical protein